MICCTATTFLPCRSLQCPGCAVKAQGHLAGEVAGLSTLTALNMQNNQLNGSLPAAYGEEGALPRLLNLVLSNNQLSGRRRAEHCATSAAGQQAMAVFAAAPAPVAHGFCAACAAFRLPLQAPCETSAAIARRHAAGGMGRTRGAPCTLAAGSGVQPPDWRAAGAAGPALPPHPVSLALL